MKKQTQSLIFQTEGKNKIRQWHFSYKKLAAIICSGVCLLGILLFLTADTLTGYFYRLKLSKIRSNYFHVTTTLTNLNSQLEILNNKIEKLEIRIAKEMDEKLYAELISLKSHRKGQ